MNHPALKHIRNTLIAALGLTGCIEQAPSMIEPALDAMLDAPLGDGAPDSLTPDVAAMRDSAPDARPIDAAPIDANPIDANPVDGAPADALTIDALPVDAAPADALPDMAPARLAPRCDGVPILGAVGAPSGYERCADGSIDRTGPASCEPEYGPGHCPEDLAGLGGCDVDSDCIGGAFGRCSAPDFPGPDGCVCSYGCATDDDCREDQTCACSIQGDVAGVGTCVRAPCAAGRDCLGGRCGLARFYEGCDIIPALACRSAEDECTGNHACQAWRGGLGKDADRGEDGLPDLDCWPAGTDGGRSGEADRWRCDWPGSVCGRPLRIAARPRLAPTAVRADWLCTRSAARLSGHDVRRLARHWATIGALEHASVASFARFSLQLLTLGAPADLIADCQKAAADEVEHARLAYGIASAFAGDAIGPGPLALDDMTIETSPAAVLREVIIEGCVGETLGALEAAEAARDAIEPAVRDACARIAEDELRHAALGWRTARWLLARHPESGAMASRAFIDGIRQHIDGVEASDDAIRQYGIATRPVLRRKAWDMVIAPIAAGLLTHT